MFKTSRGPLLRVIIIFIILSISQGSTNHRIWQEGSSSKIISYNYQNFSGFFYDLDNDIGTETIDFDLSNYENNIIGKGNLLYSTTSKEVSFKFCEWGNYSVIGFLGEKYFSGYSYNSNIINHDINFLKEDCLGKILRDEGDINYQLRERIPIDLEEGYKIEILNVNESQKSALLYLIKDKDQIDQRLITLNDSSDYTCIFTKTVINNKDVPFIILHLSAPFEGRELESITVDAIFQISENLVSLKEDFNIPNMDIISSDDRIKIKNNKNIRLDKNSIIPIFKDISIRIADSDELRFMLIQNESINYRSAPIYGKEMASYTLTPFNFEGFYYDIDNSLGTEQFNFTISEDDIFPKLDGIIYTTTAQRKRFNFTDWGYFNVIGFLGEKYLAGYIFDENIPPENQILYAESTDTNSLIDEQLQRILKDDDKEITITSGMPLKLAEGYELAIKSIGIDGNRAFVELSKDGDIVDSMVISPSKSDNPIMADKTYYYKKTIGNQKDLVIIGVHFKNAYRGADSTIATVDGVWQVSDTAREVKANTMYGKMRFANVTADTITMDNKYNSIKLDRGRKINLMGGIYIQTADADELRYLIEQCR